MADSFDLETKIARAIAALIIGNGVGNSNNTYPGAATSRDRILPNTSIVAGEGFEEDLQPGNFRFPAGQIIFHDDATIQPDDVSDQAPFLNAQQRVSAIVTQLVLSDDQTTQDYTRRQLNVFGRALAVDGSNGSDPVQASAAANNLDMADLTLIYWRIVDYGQPKKQEHATYYERIVSFECMACNSNID